MMNKVSIIIPVYNVEKYLDRCLISVVNQSYNNIEIILVDDGSQDNCPDICDEWAIKDLRVRVIHKTNGGLSDARNCGISKSQGEYITFVDSDDVIAPYFVEEMIKHITMHNGEILITNLVKFSNSEPIFYVHDSRLVSREETLVAIIKTYPQWEACGKLFKRDLFTDKHFVNGIIYEDLHLIPTIVSSADRLVFLNAGMYGYFQRFDSIMGRTSKRVSTDLIHVVSYNIDYFDKMYKENTIIRDSITAGLIIQLASKLEELRFKEIKQNKDFITHYEKFICNSIKYIRHNHEISVKYRLLLLLTYKNVYLHLFLFKFAKLLASILNIKLKR